ncbi:hypothetical protein PENTCL1PPCAC_23107, partial [Pristionchus entomophagus]
RARAIKGERNRERSESPRLLQPGPPVDRSILDPSLPIMDHLDLNLDTRAYFAGDPFLSGDSDPHLGSILDSYTNNYGLDGLVDEFPEFNDGLHPEDEFADDIFGKLDEQEMEQASILTTMNEEHAYAACSSPDESDGGSGLSLSPACSSSPSDSFPHVDILRAASDASGIYSYDTGFDATNPTQPTQQKNTMFAQSLNRQSSSSNGSSLGRRTMGKTVTNQREIGTRNGTQFTRF